MQVAMTDFFHQPFAALMQKAVLTPLGMTNSTYEQPIPAAWEKKTARAHSFLGKASEAKWHVYPEQAAAGLWTTSHDLALFALEIQKALAESGGKLLNRKSAQEMVTPVGVGAFAVGLVIEKRGEGWYFTHGGANWGFRCDLRGHIRKGYGVVIMTNSDNGGAVIKEFEERVAQAYQWDSLDKPLPR